jgi:hypothetical protein
MIKIFRADGMAYSMEISPDGQSNSQRRMEITEAEALVESGSAILYDTHEELNEAVQYASDRRNDYPAIEEQLDQMYHEGIDKWKETIQAVKDAHPKP